LVDEINWEAVLYKLIKRLLLFQVVLLLVASFQNGAWAQNPLKKRFSLTFSNICIEGVLIQIQNNHGIAFSYSKNLVKLDKKVSGTYHDAYLEDILNDLFKEGDVLYILKSGIVVLQPKPQNIDRVVLKGRVFEAESGKPLEFVGIRMINTGFVSLTDKNGQFSFLVRRRELADTIEISCLGFEKRNFPASGFTEGSNHIVYLRPIDVEIKTVDVKASDFKITSIGNHGLFMSGSIYIDTHGQQTALLITNKKGRKGTIGSVSYYLSKKGNVPMPYRIRIYQIDEMTGKPGKDLLKEFVVAKPDGPGWNKADVSVFNIEVPANGFFVAIEGIHPNEYAQAIAGDELDSEFGNTIIYGQKLGYTRKKGPNTWHYSLARTWFQLKEDNFHVMIRAEIQYRKKKMKEMNE
jgi:hypothetical protein